MKQFCFFLVLAGLTVLAGCGGATGTAANSNGTLAGNWQFALDSPSDNSFVGGLEGGFLLQNQNSVSGAAAYSIAIPLPNSTSALPAIPPPCNSGSAPISGTINGQSVMLTATAGGQTFTFTGTLSSDGLIMMGTYTSSSGITVNGVACGTAQSGLHWKASLVPPLSGTVAGSFHSTASGSLGNQNFLVTGTVQQGQNIGANSANVTGTLTFQNYSCLGGSSHQTITVNGGISGSSVVLQLFADNGLQIGEIGQSAGLNPNVSPVVFESAAPGGYIVHNSSSGPTTFGYSVSTSTCNQNAVPYFVDQGNVCLAIGGNGTACSEPFTLSPASLTFPSQLVGSTTASQTITLTNSDPAGSTLTGLSLSWNPGRGAGGFSDFNGFPNFVELDTCASPPGSTFTLLPQQSCTVTIFFSPQQSCALFLSSGVVSPPAQCAPFSTATAGPSALTASLTVKSPKSADGDKAFTVPVVGSGLSAVIPTVPQVNFGAEAVGESSAPQTLSFTNQGVFPIQVLGKASPQNACSTTPVNPIYPAQAGDTDGLRVVQSVGLSGTSNGRPLVQYTCDVDLSSNKPNFQFSSDSCTGKLLYPGDICGVGVIYAPQPHTSLASGLDYFLQLNTQQCTGNSAQPDCEIDSGRFPVELTANPQSPLRMVPGAGLDFLVQSHGTSSDPLTITLSNDSTDPLQGTVDFKGNIVTGDFTETDNCGASLAPGSSCTLNVVFTPTTTGFRQGTITINYTVPSQSLLSNQQVQTVHLRGYGS